MLKNLKDRLKNNKGFSLVELIVVIAIMVILIALLVPQVSGYIKKASDTADKVAAKSVYTAGVQLAADCASNGTPISAASLTIEKGDKVGTAASDVANNGETTSIEFEKMYLPDNLNPNAKFEVVIVKGVVKAARYTTSTDATPAATAYFYYPDDDAAKALF